MSSSSTERPPAFLAGSSALAGLIREFDWTGSALGPPRDWPQSLRSVVNLVLGSAFPMFVAWGPELRTLYNDGYAEIMGSKHPVGLGQPFLDIWQEIRADLEPLVARVQGGEGFFMENLPLQLRRHGFEENTWFTFSWSPVLDEAGAIAGIHCACIETTRTVLAEQEQRAKQEWLQMLFHLAPGFAAVLRGPEHRIEMVNEAFLHLVGHRDVIGKTVAHALPEVVDQGFIALLDGVFQTGQPFVATSMRLSMNQTTGSAARDTYVDFVYQPLLDASGLAEGIFVQGHDVTQSHQAQEALLAFSNSIPAMAWVATPDGQLQRFNSQWYSYTGQTPQTALGSGWTAALHPDDHALARNIWESARHGIEPWQTEYRLRSAHGTYRWFLAHAVPQLDPSNRVLQWFGTTADIHDAKAAAQDLREAARQKDEFLATLAHELRNPLAPIRTAVHLLSAPAASEAARAKAADVIGRQVSHMSHLLDDLIDIARITQRRLLLKKETFRLGNAVDAAMEAARPLADQKNHTVTAHVPDPAIELHADPVRITQVLSNLLNNACKYTDAGGRITLDVEPGDGWLTLTVSDTGIGLKPDAIGNLFLMFTQEQSALDRSEGGLGIGLALAKGLVDLHGGTISASSAGLGLGSRFVVRLPMQPGGQLQPVEASRTLSDAAEPGVSVLLADDNRDAADVMAELLRMSGHVVHVAHDGEQAADLALACRPDVMVLDIGMPGLNGYQVAQWVRSQPWGGTPCLVAATGWGQDDDRQKASAAGFDFHLTKPFDPGELIDLIARARKVVRAPAH